MRVIVFDGNDVGSIGALIFNEMIAFKGTPVRWQELLDAVDGVVSDLRTLRFIVQFWSEMDGVASAVALFVIFRFIIFNRAVCSAFIVRRI